MRRTLALVGLALLLVSILAAPVAGAPPPRPLCDACGETFAETADGFGVDVVVAHSTATVRVTANGTAIWTVHNELQQSGATARLRTNETLRAAIAERAMWDAELLGSNVSADGVVTMRYREAAFATPSVGGTLRSGAFTEAYGYRNLHGLGADRLTVVAPEGMTIGWSAPGATVADDRSRMTLTELDDTGFVTFVESGDTLAPLWSLLSVLDLVGPAVALNIAISIVVPTAVFGVCFGALCGALAWLDPDLGVVADRIPTVLGVLGAVTAVGSLLAATESVLGTSNGPVFGAGVGIGALGALCSMWPGKVARSYRTLLGLSAVGLAVGVGATVASAPLFHSGGLLRSQVVALWFLVPVFACLPAGYALARGRRRLAVATAVCAFAVAVLPLFAPLGIPFLAGFVSSLYAVSVAVCGLPLLLAGLALADANL